jgi:hypothetical protein
MASEPKRIGQSAISILALVVSVTTALISYYQSRTSSTQLLLIKQQLRPHVTYVPTFFRTKSGLDVDVYLQNESPLPANVLYTDLAAWVGGDFVNPNFHSLAPISCTREKVAFRACPCLKGSHFHGSIKVMILFSPRALFTRLRQSPTRVGGNFERFISTYPVHLFRSGSS